MQYDLGTTGLALLVVMSLAFGVVAQLIAGIRTAWVWLAGSVGYFVGGLIASELMFAWATDGDLQPLIDGLFFDEALFGGLIVGGIAAAVTWFEMRRRVAEPQTT